MKETKLISMTDFVLNINKLVPKDYDQFFESWQNKKIKIIEKYANFLKQPLKLEMFVPCDLDGNILSENYSYKENTKNKTFFQLAEEYKQAKEKVLFDGFEIRKAYHISGLFNEKENMFFGSFLEYEEETEFSFFPENKTIEDLIKYNLTLTENAIKQLGL